MDELAGRTGASRGVSENRQQYAVDGGCLSDAHVKDFSNSDSCESASEPTLLADLSASFRIFSESLLRKELSELEMMKSREALRCEAEKRRLELEAELTQMLVQTQLQIASFVAGKGMNKNRKRKRAEEEESPISQRDSALLLSLLQCNFLF